MTYQLELFSEEEVKDNRIEVAFYSIKFEDLIQEIPKFSVDVLQKESIVHKVSCSAILNLYERLRNEQNSDNTESYECPQSPQCGLFGYL